MPVCRPDGTFASGNHRRSYGLVFLAFGVSFSAVLVRAQDDPGRPKSAQQPPGGDRVPPAPPDPRTYGELRLPQEGEIADPGMTLDQAIDRLLKENLYLRAAHDEIDMAEADVEAAGQPPRASLLINVGAGGIRTATVRAQEIVPRVWIDTLVARAAKRVLEAQYQDAIRLQVDNLYDAFLDVQVAETRVRFAKVALQGMTRLLEQTEFLQKRDVVETSDVARLKAARETATIALGDAEADVKKTRLVLGNLLNLPDAEVERLQVSSNLAQFSGSSREPPAAEELIRRALRHRPDLRAYRLGVERARADWLKALVEPLSQMTLSPWLERSDPPGSRRAGIAPARGLGVVVSLPTTIRNRGVLKRAEINVKQTKTELAKLERDVILDVRKARLEYDQARAAVDRFRKEIIPAARELRDHQYRLLMEGKASLAEYIEGQNQFNERVQEYRDQMIRLRRSTLAINTAVGERIMR